MALTEEDKILIKVLRQEHGYGANRFLKEFSNKGWCLSSVIMLLKKIDETGTMKRKPGSDKKSTTRTVENVELVKRLALSQENAPDQELIKQWRPRLRSCVRERGGHFEHQL